MSPYVVVDFSTPEKRSTIIEEKPGAVRKWIDDVLKEHDIIREITRWGISRNLRSGNQFGVFFKDEKAVVTGRRNDASLEGFYGTQF